MYQLASRAMVFTIPGMCMRHTCRAKNLCKAAIQYNMIVVTTSRPWQPRLCVRSLQQRLMQQPSVRTQATLLTRTVQPESTPGLSIILSRVRVAVRLPGMYGYVDLDRRLCPEPPQWPRPCPRVVVVCCVYNTETSLYDLMVLLHSHYTRDDLDIVQVCICYG